MMKNDVVVRFPLSTVLASGREHACSSAAIGLALRTRVPRKTELKPAVFDDLLE